MNTTLLLCLASAFAGGLVSAIICAIVFFAFIAGVTVAADEAETELIY